MKKIFLKQIAFTTVILLIISGAKAQVSIVFENSSEKFERSKYFDKTVYIQIKVKGSLTTAPSSIAINISRNDNAGSYSLSQSNFSLSVLSTGVQIPFIIKKGDAQKTGDTVIVNFTDNITTMIRSTELIILSEEEDDKDNTPKNKKQIMFLNAYNFDFGGKALSSNYVGHLNFFVPSCSKTDKWGFNTGIMKINYSQKDTSNSNGMLVRENVFIGPFDTLSNGLKYLKQINGYKTEKRNAVWSFYVQPLYEFTKKEDNFHVYGHLHLELLASKWSSTTTVTNIKQDTGIYTTPANNFVIRSGLQNSSTYTVNSLSGYFGVGFTFDINPWDGGSFFFQPTVGYTSNKPSPSSLDIDSKGAISYSVGKEEKPRIWNSFYLVRAYYKHVIAKEKATAVVGVDIRGLLPLYAPQYAVYAGLNLSLDSIFGLISGEKK